MEDVLLALFAAWEPRESCKSWLLLVVEGVIAGNYGKEIDEMIQSHLPNVVTTVNIKQELRLHPKWVNSE